MKESKVLTIQDFSSYGQCSISVALPIISAAGCETVALPVALLSTHTSEFKDYTNVDLSDNLLPSARHIKRSGGDFDYIYVGYLGKSENIEKVENILGLYPTAKLVIDPAMAESGQLYDGIRPEYVKDITNLCKKSLLCLPNFTEACLMADERYTSYPDARLIDSICDKLSDKEINSFAITGVKLNDDLAVIYQNGSTRKILPVKETEGKYYGAGDVFSSVVTGCLARGADTLKSLEIAIDFTGKAVEETSKDKSHWYGLKFENLLSYLIDRLKNSLN